MYPRALVGQERHLGIYTSHTDVGAVQEGCWGLKSDLFHHYVPIKLLYYPKLQCMHIIYLLGVPVTNDHPNPGQYL